MSARGDTRGEKLRRAARPLKPTKPPFYVDHTQAVLRGYALIGWYWQPAGAAGELALAPTYEAAIIAIDRKVQEARAAAAAAAAAAAELAELERAA